MHGGKKALFITWNRIFHCFSFETSTLKNKFEANGKSCFSPRAGKIPSL